MNSKNYRLRLAADFTGLLWGIMLNAESKVEPVMPETPKPLHPHLKYRQEQKADKFSSTMIPR
jgi:hypothetical protein